MEERKVEYWEYTASDDTVFRSRSDCLKYEHELEKRTVYTVFSKFSLISDIAVLTFSSREYAEKYRKAVFGSENSPETWIEPIYVDCRKGDERVIEYEKEKRKKCYY